MVLSATFPKSSGLGVGASAQNERRATSATVTLGSSGSVLWTSSVPLRCAGSAAGPALKATSTLALPAGGSSSGSAGGFCNVKVGSFMAPKSSASTVHGPVPSLRSTNSRSTRPPGGVVSKSSVRGSTLSAQVTAAGKRAGLTGAVRPQPSSNRKHPAKTRCMPGLIALRARGKGER